MLPTSLPATGPAEDALASERGGKGEGVSSVVWEELDPPQKTAYCVFLYAMAFITPMLMLLSDINSFTCATYLLFIGIAVGVAWYKNRRLKITITGPNSPRAT